MSRGEAIQNWKRALCHIGWQMEQVDIDPARHFHDHDTVEIVHACCFSRFDSYFRMLIEKCQVLNNNYAQSEAKSYTSDFEAMLKSWRFETAPSMPSIMAYVFDGLGYAPNDPLCRLALAGGVLGEIHHGHAYHSNQHFREVLAFALSLCVQNNNLIDAGLFMDNRRIGDDDIKIMAFAASIHDLFYDADAPDKESRSFQGVKPYIRHFLKDEMDADGIQVVMDKVRLMLLGTSVDKGNGDKSHATALKEIHAYHFDGAAAPTMIPPDIMAFYHDADLCHLAMTLHEADIAASVGLSYNFSMMLTDLCKHEYEWVNDLSSMFLAFVDNTVQARMHSPAAKFLIEPNLHEIRSTVVEDVRQKTALSGTMDG